MLIISCHYSFSQNELEYAPYTSYIQIDKDNSFLISTKPVTNREYIIYLVWLLHTEFVNYPQVLLDAIPDFHPKNIDGFWDEFYESKNPFALLFKYSEPFLKNYMFNPIYIDYPVIGVSWLQANKYCKWLTDRYNEYKLIQHGYNLPNKTEFSEDCFVTESYIAGQYMGLRKIEKDVKWKDQLLIPDFRLPSKNEINHSLKNKDYSNEFKSYKNNQDNFLSLWEKWYLKVNDTSIIYYKDVFNTSSNKFSDTAINIKQPNNKWELNRYKYEELTLDINSTTNEPNLLEIYKQIGQAKFNIVKEEPEKDSLGQMRFIIIGEDENKQPIAVERYKNNNQPVLDLNKFYFFRYACCIKPKQYKP